MEQSTNGITQNKIGKYNTSSLAGNILLPHVTVIATIHKIMICIAKATSGLASNPGKRGCIHDTNTPRIRLPGNGFSSHFLQKRSCLTNFPERGWTNLVLSIDSWIEVKGSGEFLKAMPGYVSGLLLTISSTSNINLWVIHHVAADIMFRTDLQYG